MRDSDLAEYLDYDPFLGHSEPQLGVPAKSDVKSEPELLAPVTPEQPRRSAVFEPDKHESDMVRMVMDVFPGASWTTREEYKRASEVRDRQWRKTRG
jgi:hypothetical protein